MRRMRSRRRRRVVQEAVEFGAGAVEVLHQAGAIDPERPEDLGRATERLFDILSKKIVTP
jgi:hypothetical protein